MDFRRQRRDVDRGVVGKGGKHALDLGGLDGRKVALQVDDDVGPPFGVQHPERLVNPVRPGSVIRIGHDRFAAMGPYRRGDLGRVGGDRDAADLRGFGAPQDVHDHRQAGDIQ